MEGPLKAIEIPPCGCHPSCMRCDTISSSCFFFFASAVPLPSLRA